MSSPIAGPSIVDVFNLLQSTLTELASMKHTLAALQTSNNVLHASNESLKASNESLKATIAQNHRQVIQELEKLRNPTKKHYTLLTSLPKEVMGVIMSWIHPQDVWRFRRLSQSFKQLLSSSGFAALNLRRFVPSYDPLLVSADFKDSEEFNGWDVVFIRAPSSYQSEYGRMYLTCRSTIKVHFKFNCPLPRLFIPHLKNLTALELVSCSLTGAIPYEIGILLNLQTLNLSYNSLEGEIPSSIGNLVNLKYLFLFSNHGICGVLPAELGCLLSLKVLDITGTSLMGPIPIEIDNLKNLIILNLNLQKNPLRPTYLLPELGKLSNLYFLHLANCHLVGTIPKELGNQNLRELSLLDNNLVGQVPVELLNIEEVSLKGNPDLTIPFQVPESWSTDVEQQRF